MFFVIMAFIGAFSSGFLSCLALACLLAAFDKKRKGRGKDEGASYRYRDIF